MPITLSNITYFQNVFTIQIKRKIVVIMPLNISTRLICVATLPCKMSEIALKPATTLIYCVINVDQA